MLQHLPIDKVVQLPWSNVINSLKPAHVNRLRPVTIGAIPWHDVLPVVEPDLLKQFSISVSYHNFIQVCFVWNIKGRKPFSRDERTSTVYVFPFLSVFFNINK